MIETPLNPMKRLFRYLGKYQNKLWFATSASVVNKVFDLMPPFLTAWLIDTVSGNTPAWITRWTGLDEQWPIIIFLTILTFLIFGGESFFEWLFKRSFMRLAQSVQHELRLKSYQHLQKREMAFFENQRTGNLMSMLNDDINQLERFLNNIFNEIIQLITLVLVAGWSLCAVSLPLGLIGMAPIPFIVLGSLYYQRKVAPHYQSVREGVGRLSTRLENNLSGILVIKSFTAEQFEAERVKEVSEQYRDANFKAIRWSSVYVPIIRIFISIGFAVTLMIGAYWVLFEPGKFSIGSLAFFAMMTQRLLWPVTRLGVVFDEYERARAAARRIFGLLDTPNQIQDPEEGSSFHQPVKGHIHLKAVDFQYLPDQPILQNLNLEIKAGQTIGIAGPTGGGKTTLIKLLLRLYDVTNGSIKIDDKDIRTLNLKALRQQMALVSQDVYLFHGSIKENIAYGRMDLSDQEIREAAQKAQLAEFIESLPLQYETIVGERGIKLSGGQRQRMSIARAIIKNAPILILDEATSAVDTETEKAIQESLNFLVKGKTAIIIAHRLSTIRQADTILVMKDGQIVEQGTHDFLLQKSGEYARLWKVQTGIRGGRM
ncbi:MAG: ABC transporter ATP-binding protein/permease [Chitinophagales bacterium]|nr:ABC transporter ATP-binding protein/permease [Chitinophagales bacterium]